MATKNAITFRSACTKHLHETKTVCQGSIHGAFVGEEPSVAWFSHCSSGPSAVDTELGRCDKRRYAHGEERNELQRVHRIKGLCGWYADLAEAYNESLYMRAFPASLIKQAGYVCN
jgi:hypothetical protein